MGAFPVGHSATPDPSGTRFIIVAPEGSDWLVWRFDLGPEWYEPAPGGGWTFNLDALVSGASNDTLTMLAVAELHENKSATHAGLSMDMGATGHGRGAWASQRPDAVLSLVFLAAMEPQLEGVLQLEVNIGSSETDVVHQAPLAFGQGAQLSMYEYADGVERISRNAEISREPALPSSPIDAERVRLGVRHPVEGASWHHGRVVIGDWFGYGTAEAEARRDADEIFVRHALAGPAFPALIVQSTAVVEELAEIELSATHATTPLSPGRVFAVSAFSVPIDPTSIGITIASLGTVTRSSIGVGLPGDCPAAPIIHGPGMDLC